MDFSIFRQKNAKIDRLEAVEAMDVTFNQIQVS